MNGDMLLMTGSTFPLVAATVSPKVCRVECSYKSDESSGSITDSGSSTFDLLLRLRPYLTKFPSLSISVCGIIIDTIAGGVVCASPPYCYEGPRRILTTGLCDA